MNNQAKIAELKKNINNKFFPEALKPKLLAQIEKLEAEDKQSSKHNFNPKGFKVNDIVANIDKKTVGIVRDVYDDGELRTNEDGNVYISDLDFYDSKKHKNYKISPSTQTEIDKGILPHPKPKQSKTSIAKNVDYDKMSDADFAFTTLGKIVAADGQAWNKTKADSGSEIRNSEKLTKLYATSLEKSLKDLKVKKNSLTEKEYDYLVDNNYHLLNEFLFWNDFYENDFAKGQKEMYQRMFDDKSNHSSVANPDWIIVGKGILPHPKPKKPTVARKVKSELKKYYAHREIKTVTVIEDGKKVVYKGEDVLNGAQFLAKGGKVEEIATYYPIRAIVEVTLDNGEKVKPANGYHIKNGAKPIAELGAALATEEIINNSIVDYHNPRFAYAEGGQIDDVIIEVEQIVDIALDNKITASNLTFNEFSEAIFDKSKISFGKSYLKLAYDSLKDVNYAEGGDVATSGSGDFDYIKFLDFVQPKVAATLLENNITLLNDYTIVHDGKEYEPEIIYKGINGKANSLSVGYFADNDPQLKLLLSIDFELEEMEYHIRSKGWNINDVDMYAKGGWVKDHKYLNKAEAYEMRYAKGKNRKGYMEKGGEVFDYKNKYSPLNITNSNDVKNFFNYLTNVEKISFHPDDKFEGNMNDSFTKKQAINLDKYMDDCFLIMNLPKNKDKDIYEIALNSQQSFAKGGPIIGRKAKGVSVKKIADMHNVTEKYLRKQLQRGQKVELEHTTDEAVAYAIAKDHIYENPDYYILLGKIEMKANGGEVKKEWVIVKPNGYYSLNASSGGGRFLPSLEMAYTYSEEEAKKLAETLQKESPNVTIKAVKYGTPLENDPYDKYAKGGLVDWKSSANSGKKVLGVYEVNSPSFKGNIEIVGFEQVDDTYYSLYQPLYGDRIGPKEIHSLDVNSNKINNLDKGLVVIALDQNKNKVKIKRLGNRFSGDFKIGEFKEGGEVSKNLKPKREGSQIFAKAAEIREPGEKWQEAVRRANLLLKK